jgi:hypothetical protein
MKILFCNKYNYPFSGTEVYLFELMELLRSHGHEISLFSMAAERDEAEASHLVSHIDFKGRAGLGQHARRAAHAFIPPKHARKSAR